MGERVRLTDSSFYYLLLRLNKFELGNTTYRTAEGSLLTNLEEMPSVIARIIAHRKSEGLWFLTTYTTSDNQLPPYIRFTSLIILLQRTQTEFKAPCRLAWNYILNAGYSRGYLFLTLMKKKTINLSPCGLVTIPFLDRDPIPYVRGFRRKMKLGSVFWFFPAARKEKGKALGDCNLFPRVEEELNYSYRLGKHV